MKIKPFDPSMAIVVLVFCATTVLFAGQSINKASGKLDVQRVHDSTVNYIESDTSELHRAWRYWMCPDTMYQGHYFEGHRYISTYNKMVDTLWVKIDTIIMR